MYQESIVYSSNNKTGIYGSFYFSSKSLEMFTLKKRAFATDCTNEILFWFLMFAFGDLLHN